MLTYRWLSLLFGQRTCIGKVYIVWFYEKSWCVYVCVYTMCVCRMCVRYEKNEVTVTLFVFCIDDSLIYLNSFIVCKDFQSSFFPLSFIDCKSSLLCFSFVKSFNYQQSFIILHIYFLIGYIYFSYKCILKCSFNICWMILQIQIQSFTFLF